MLRRSVILALGLLTLLAAQYLLDDAHTHSQKERLRTGRGVIVPARIANDALDQLANRSVLLRPEEKLSVVDVLSPFTTQYGIDLQFKPPDDRQLHLIGEAPNGFASVVLRIVDKGTRP